MTLKEITDKVAVLKASLKTAPTKMRKEAIKKKIAELKDEAKGMGVPISRYAKSLIGSDKKFFAMSDADKKDTIRRLSKRREYDFLVTPKAGMKSQYVNNISKVEKDKKRYAKPVGWRFRGRNKVSKPTKKQLELGKKRGTVYYEDRPDRADVVRPVKLADGGMMAKGRSINDIKITYADDFAHKKGINSTMIEVGADLFVLGDSIKDHLRGFIIKEQKHLKNQNKEYKNNSMLSFGGRDVLDKITWDVEHSDNKEKSWRESKYYVVIQDGCSPLAVAHFFYLLGKYTSN